MASKSRKLWTWIAVLGIPALLVLTVPLPYSMEASDATLCDTTPKSANLNFTLKDAGGKDFDLSAQKGKVVILDFWATWCPPCKVEIPWFIEFQSKYGPKDFTVIGVSVDDSMAKLKPFADRYKMNYPVLTSKVRTESAGGCQKRSSSAATAVSARCTWACR